MHLSGDELRKLRLAITSAYPSKGDLMIMAREKLEVNLDAVAGGKDYTEVVFSLIQWAESRGKLEQLIESLCKERPKNEVFKKIKYKLFPNLFDLTDIKLNICPISIEQFNNVFLVFTEIDLDILKRVCKETLENSSKSQDIFGNFPELTNPKSLVIFKTIFLENNYKNDKNIPSIIEFTERLSQEKGVSSNIQVKLNNWVEIIAQELNIKLPTYEERKSSTATLNSYLLVTVTPNSTDTFYLQAELILNYLDKNTNTEPIKLELNSDFPHIECSLSQIVNIIDKFIHIAQTQHFKEYLLNRQRYNLKVEVFLPLEIIDTNINLKKVPIGGTEQKEKEFGIKYRFLVRLRERYTFDNGESFNKLIERWEEFDNWKQNTICEENIQTKIHNIPNIDDCNWEEIEIILEDEKKLGVKVTCCLPETNNKIKLFHAILIGGVPICLWTRCHLPNIDDDFDELLNIEFFKDESASIESVFKFRRKAHAKPEKENYLDYHLGLGFLCDNPHRVPSNLMLQNQTLTETGM
ncbi:effector-associated domain EAD1-containing protein [Calothrix sp. CCY 0018]|uniref:effector-associated domain EAD1-containing protein n=1 Tax=Calothrix sp. CCY 0018 TaxID=3103864 RepID=UPI0039C691D9